MERTDIITFKGNGMTLVGNPTQVGDTAPDFTCVDSDLNPVSLSDFKGQVVILSTVPSLDTGVCEEQTKKFNETASNLSAKIFTISEDLPFAQKRFCGANGIENITVLSDYRDREMAQAYGLLIKELVLMTRAVFVIDKEGKIVYQEIVSEVTHHPDYDQVIEAAKAVGA